jgi:hypothetical protein
MQPRAASAGENNAFTFHKMGKLAVFSFPRPASEAALARGTFLTGGATSIVQDHRNPHPEYLASFRLPSAPLELCPYV